MKTSGKSALVTGASMGIGAAVALRLARGGTNVIVTARSEDKLQALAAQNKRITYIAADITEDEGRRRIAEFAGDVDILVNNAGLATYGLVEMQDEATVRHMFELNVLSLIDMTQRVLPGMLERRSGHICNVGSSISHINIPPMTIYGATKFAVEGFSDGLRREVLTRGVGVSLIQPGPVKTAFWDRAASGDHADVDASKGFGISPELVARAVVNAIRFDKVPGFATVAVPRVLGLGRVLDLPVVSYLIDQSTARTTPAP